MSTLPGAEQHFSRQHPPMEYKPTWLEREGEAFVILLGMAAFGFALGILIVGLVFA